MTFHLTRFELLLVCFRLAFNIIRVKYPQSHLLVFKLEFPEPKACGHPRQASIRRDEWTSKLNSVLPSSIFSPCCLISYHLKTICDYKTIFLFVLLENADNWDFTIGPSEREKSKLEAHNVSRNETGNLVWIAHKRKKELDRQSFIWYNLWHRVLCCLHSSLEPKTKHHLY